MSFKFGSAPNSAVFVGDTTKSSLFGSTGPEVQSTNVEPGKEKLEIEPATKNTCSECNRYCNKKIQDTRNQHFSELLQDELQYIQPCMRTTVYAKILNFLHATKKSHFNNEVSDAELKKSYDEVSLQEGTS